jgi:hypothetical protein
MEGAPLPPPGWVLSYSKTHKRHYYFNTKLNTTQWHLPLSLPIVDLNQREESSLSTQTKVVVTVPPPKSSFLGGLLGSVDLFANSVAKAGTSFNRTILFFS